MNEKSLPEFLAALASKDPVPGGGGASALIGALGASLCSMVANLTSGKPKYAEYQADIEKILSLAAASSTRLLELIEEDAKGFEPLAAAYAIPKDNPDRAEILEAALAEACAAPLGIVKEAANVAGLAEALLSKGSKLAVSDVGVAATACRAAMEGAAMNIFINTKLLKNRDHAAKLNEQAKAALEEGVDKCEAIYKKITSELT